jgi:hypothetical protein
MHCQFSGHGYTVTAANAVERQEDIPGAELHAVIALTPQTGRKTKSDGYCAIEAGSSCHVQPCMFTKVVHTPSIIACTYAANLTGPCFGKAFANRCRPFMGCTAEGCAQDKACLDGALQTCACLGRLSAPHACPHVCQLHCAISRDKGVTDVQEHSKHNLRAVLAAAGVRGRGGKG